MSAYCENCGLIDLYTIGSEVMETIDIDGVKFECMQRHAYCAICNEKVYPNDVIDANISIAHAAYCHAVGKPVINRTYRTE